MFAAGAGLEPLRGGESLKRFAVGVVLFAVASVAFAATEDFYLRMFQRGLDHFAAGNYATAFDELRMAAFGMVDSIDDFERAHVYATVAAQKLKRESDARNSLQRVLAAEKIEHRYTSLKLPDEVKSAFEDAARSLLRRDEIAQLRIGVVPATPAPTPVAPQPTPSVSLPKPVASQHPASKPVNVEGALADAERAITTGQLERARTIYRPLMEETLSHPQLLRLAEGLYRSRDFANTVHVFVRVLPLQKTEEPYRYYYAVALYETGAFAAAKRELTVVMPFIEVTPDVARYRAKIERGE
jgi:hypothetical protein